MIRQPHLIRFFDWIIHIFRTIPSIKRPKVNLLSVSQKVGIGFIVIGILLILIPRVFSFFKQPQKGTDALPIKADSNFQSVPSVTQTPIRIIIPSLNIDIPIQTASLIHGYWEVSEHTASFGNGSAIPGTVGNTVVFAHARAGLFLPLKNITFGKEIYVLTSIQWFRYRVDEIREVAPTDVYVVKKTDDNRLTLYTCSGFFDQKRLVVIAKPVK